jgi:N-methylhydantoinase B
MCEQATVVLLGDRHKKPPYGLFGGNSGTVARTVLIRDGQEIELGSKEVRQLRRGDIVSFRLAGAGGYGDPKQRSHEALQQDVADGYISKAKAIELYGVTQAELER